MTLGASGHERRGLRAKEVCEQMGIQPYVLKFWESEFPQLGRRVGAKRLYKDESMTIVGEIHRLVEEERLTLSEARESLEERFPARPPAPEPVESWTSPEAVESPDTPDPVQTSLFREAEARIQQLQQQLEESQQQLAENQGQLTESLRDLEAGQQQREAGQKQLEASHRELEISQQRAAQLQPLEERLRELEQQAGQVEPFAERTRELERSLQEQAFHSEKLAAELKDSTKQLHLLEDRCQGLEDERHALTRQLEQAGAAEELLEEAEQARSGLQQQLEGERRELLSLRKRLTGQVNGALTEVRALLELMNPES